MHFLLSTMNVVYVLTTPIFDDGDDATLEQIRKRKLWDSFEAKYMAEDASSEKLLDSDYLKGNNVAGPSVVHMMEHNNSIRYNDNKGKRKHQDTKADHNKKSKVTCWKCEKPVHLKKDCKGGKFGVTVYVCKDRCWLKTYESLNDGSILHMGNESTTLVHRRGCVDLRFSSRKIVSLAVVKLSDPKLKTLGERGIECIFVRYVEHFKALVLRPSQRSLINKSKDIGGSVVPEEVVV
ncbi:hypothetical protein Tco_1215860 [Tanacetum coccineum]